MPGKHSAKERRQAMHIAASERARGVTPSRALQIGWASVNSKHKSNSKEKRKMAMPPALARYWAKHGRTGSGRKRSGSRSTALVRSGSRSITIRTAPAKPAKRGHGGRRRHHSTSGTLSRERKAWLGAWGAILGYVVEVKKLDLLDKIPEVGKVPKLLLVGAGAELLGLTKKHRQIDNAATAMIVKGGYDLGASGFALSGDEE